MDFAPKQLQFSLDSNVASWGPLSDRVNRSHSSVVQLGELAKSFDNPEQILKAFDRVILDRLAVSVLALDSGYAYRICLELRDMMVTGTVTCLPVGSLLFGEVQATQALTSAQ